MADSLIIGIDLGTTNSCIAYLYENNINIVENKEGGRTTPSFVFFTDAGGVIVGEYAKHMAPNKTENGIYEIKRLIGRSFKDLNLQDNLRYLAYEVRSDCGNPLISLKGKNGPIQKSPIEICAHILEKLKKDTEEKLGRRVDKLVLTVPAYFNVNQRKATLEAAENAGFTVLKLLNEPTAAAINYYLENKHEGEVYSLVYDLGGGTFDVAIVKRNNNALQTLSVDGDSHLGGQDLDRLIMDYVLHELLNRYKCDPREDKRSLRILRSKCEKAKKFLSTAEETSIILECFFRRDDVMEISLTRAQFETMADHLFRRTIDITDRCLTNSKLSKDQIAHVILSGGSTRIPKIQLMITRYFDGKPLCKFVNPDECVAKGAAVQAAMLSQHVHQNTDDMTITDVTSLSLGMKAFGNCMKVIIPKNSALPISCSKYFALGNYSVHKIEVNIYEGERADVRKNYYLGSFTVDSLTPAPPGQCKVAVNMNIDRNGILTVTAEEMNKNNKRELQLTYRNNFDAENAIKNAAENKQEDEHFLRCARKKSHLKHYCESITYNIENRNLLEKHHKIYDSCKEILMKLASLELEDEPKIEKMTGKVKRQCEKLIVQHKFTHMPEN